MTEAIYTYGTAENAQFLAEQRDALFNFGTRFPSEEGSSYWLGDDGTPWVERDRATWITCRMTHVYALAAFIGFEGAEKLVDAGLKGVCSVSFMMTTMMAGILLCRHRENLLQISNATRMLSFC